MLRSRFWQLALLGMLAAAAAVGSYAWHIRQRRALDQHVDVALSALRSEGSLDVVYDAMAQLAGRHDRQSELALLEGGARLRSGDPSGALVALGTVRPHGKLRVPFSLMKGEALYLRGRLADAESVFRELASEHPDEAEAHRWLA